MKELSIYTSLGKGTIEERMTAIKNAGFNTVCLDFEKEILHIDGSWESQVSLAVRTGLMIENVHLTGDGMTNIWSEGEQGERVTERLIQELRALSGLGLYKGVCHVTWGHAKQMKRDFAVFTELQRQLSVTVYTLPLKIPFFPNTFSLFLTILKVSTSVSATTVDTSMHLPPILIIFPNSATGFLLCIFMTTTAFTTTILFHSAVQLIGIQR